MKLSVLFSLLFFVITTSLKAQEIQLGVKGGANLSTVSGDFTEANNPRLGYHFGGFVKIPFRSNFSFNPELLYSSIGYTYDYFSQNFDNFDPDPSGGEISFKSVDRFNYLTIPLNLRMNFSDRFGIDFGPQVSFLLNTVSKLKESTGINEENNRRTYPGNFKADYGANIGFTFSLNEKINIQLRYYQGLNNLINSEFFPDDRSFNVALQLSAGYVIF